MTATRRWPIVPTLLVLLAVAAMIGLGLWQLLDRRPQKLAYLDQLRANPMLPMIAMPRRSDDRLLFRRATATCAAPVAIRLAGAGAAGFRAIATCRDGIVVQLGTTTDPGARPAWPGGTIVGYLVHAPDRRSLIETAFDRTPPPMMLVATIPQAGLTANAAPDVESVPNNHLAYAVQWFLFAVIAATIYVLAVLRRRR